MKKCIKRKKLCGYFWGGASLVLLSIVQQAQAGCKLLTGPSAGGSASHSGLVVSLVSIPQVYRGSPSNEKAYINEFEVKCDGPSKMKLLANSSYIQSGLTNITGGSGIVTYTVTAPDGTTGAIAYDILYNKIASGRGMEHDSVTGTYKIRVTSPASRRVESESYMRDYTIGSSADVLTIEPLYAGSSFTGQLQAGMTNFKRDPCASRDSFSLDYIGGRDIRVPPLTGRAAGTIKTPSFGIQVNLIREQSKPSTCAALVEPEIRFRDSVVQLRTTGAGARVDNGFELRLYRVDGGALVGNSTIKMKQFNPARGTYSSRMDFYGQVTRNPQKAVVEGEFRGTMNFTVIYR